MRASVAIVAVFLVGGSALAQSSPFGFGLDTQSARASHESDVALDKAMVLTASVQVLRDQGFRVRTPNEEKGTVTTDWANEPGPGAGINPNPAQNRVTVALDKDGTTVRLDLIRRSQQTKFELVPGVQRDKAEAILAQIVRVMSDGTLGQARGVGWEPSVPTELTGPTPLSDPVDPQP